jgi:hypothetical protein
VGAPTEIVGLLKALDAHTDLVLTPPTEHITEAATAIQVLGARTGAVAIIIEVAYAIERPHIVSTHADALHHAPTAFE